MSGLTYDSRGQEKSFLSSVKIILQRRILVFELARIELFHKYKGSVLGIFWSFLNPLLITSIIYFVFGKLFNSYMPENRGYAVWVYSGILLQILLIQGLTVAAGSIQRNLNVITKNRIPPVIMAFSASLAHSINFFLGSFLILPLCFLTNQQISLRLLFFPFYIILSAIALTGFGILVTGLFMKYDDTIFIFNAGTMVLSYLTPIFYPIQILSGSIYTIVSLNPLTSWILTLRWIFLEESRVEIFNLFVVLGSSLGLFLAGTMTLKYRWKYWQML